METDSVSHSGKRLFNADELNDSFIVNLETGLGKMEELTVEAILGLLGYGSYEEYQRILNSLWETAPEEYEPLLLELESRNYKDALIYLIHRSPVFSNSDRKAVFGKYLIQRLQTIYNQMTLEEFGSLAYSVWGMLPGTINMEEPFYTLNYADDELSYGNDYSCRKLYQKMFKFYTQSEE
jgi:hypothetical protein